MKESVVWERWRTLAEDVRGTGLLASSRERRLAEATLALLEVAEATEACLAGSGLDAGKWSAMNAALNAAQRKASA